MNVRRTYLPFLVPPLFAAACAGQPPRDSEEDKRGIFENDHTPSAPVISPNLPAADWIGRWVSELDDADSRVAKAAAVNLRRRADAARTHLYATKAFPATLEGRRMAFEFMMDKAPMEDDAAARRELLRREISRWHDDCVESGHEPNRLKALNWLDQLASPDDADFFVKSALDSSRHVRWIAAHALQRRIARLTKEHLRAFLDGMEANDPDLRSDAAMLLATLYRKLVVGAPDPAKPAPVFSGGAPAAARAAQAAQWRMWVEQEAEALLRRFAAHHADSSSGTKDSASGK